MAKIRPKKSLGQHFLIDEGIVFDICEAVPTNSELVLEVGPGTGALTHQLHERFGDKLVLCEVDDRSVNLLRAQFPNTKIIHQSFLDMDLANLGEKVNVVGNFPYNISNQIMFKVLENKEVIRHVVGMFQKEVAQRLCASPGSKSYGILSVLLTAYFQSQYLFEVDKDRFDPPPKVQSAVIEFSRNNIDELPCSDADLKRVVKAAFGQRRKKLRNALRAIIQEEHLSLEIMDLRAEQLSLEQFIYLTNLSGQK